VLNLDDAFGRELAAEPVAGAEDLTYSASGAADAHFAAEQVHRDDTGLRFTVRTPHGRVEIESRLLGHFNVDNLLATFAALSAVGLSGREIAARLAQLDAVPGRLERFSAAGAPTAVVDYAHTPQALQAALEALRPHCRGQLWCLFGCGGERDRGKRALMAQAAEQGADRVIVSDDNPRREDPQTIIDDILAGFAEPSAVLVERDRARAIAAALGEAQPQDWLLVAGKGHEDYQIFGSEKVSYSDRETVRAALREVGQR
jgi:UDP-N-acetylmuramoyl-L-alanyl-D-glutamate--2,6-diaminopimelate ligase